METKINIAAILKDKPQGTKLYDWLHNIDVELDTISTTDTETVVWCTNETNNNTTCHRGYSEFGTERGCPDGLQILFPSKEMRDWYKFSWQKGDVLISNDGGTEVIFDKWYNDTYTSFYCKHYLNSEDKNNIKYNETFLCTTERYSLEDKDIAQTYINTIEKRLDGKLNLETLEIEKQPKFKDGDILSCDEDSFTRHTTLILHKDENITESIVSLVRHKKLVETNVPIDNFLLSRLYPAREDEKKELFDALTKKGKAWDSEKKQIVDLKPKFDELKPFDNVLVRHQKTEEWRANIFSHTDKTDEYLDYVCVNGRWEFCIPYIGNESLLGTTKDVEG